MKNVLVASEFWSYEFQEVWLLCLMLKNVFSFCKKLQNCLLRCLYHFAFQLLRPAGQLPRNSTHTSAWSDWLNSRLTCSNIRLFLVWPQDSYKMVPEKTQCCQILLFVLANFWCSVPDNPFSAHLLKGLTIANIYLLQISGVFVKDPRTIPLKYNRQEGHLCFPVTAME